MKNELQPLRLFSPLFPHIYRKNEWGDIDNNREALTVGEVLEYEDEILALIQKEKLSDEGERGLAVYLDDDLSQKVYSINPSVMAHNFLAYLLEQGKISPAEFQIADEFVVEKYKPRLRII